MKKTEQSDNILINMLLFIFLFAIFITSCPAFIVLNLLIDMPEIKNLYYGTMVSSIVSGISCFHFYNELNKSTIKKNDS